MVAIVLVRAFGIGRPLLRYAERLVGHDAALRMLAARRAEVYDTVVPLTPGALGRRRGDVLASVVDDVDAVLDDRLRVRLPLLTLAGVGALAAGLGALLLPVAGAAVAALVLTTFATALGVRAAVRRVEPDLVRQRALLSTRVLEAVQSARHLVLWQATGAAAGRVEEASTALARSVRRSAARVALGRAAVSLLAGAALTVVAVGGTAAVAAGRLTGPAAAAVLLLPLALLDVLVPVPDAAALSVRTRAARARLDALAQATPAVTSPDPAAPAPERPHGRARGRPGRRLVRPGLRGARPHPARGGARRGGRPVGVRQVDAGRRAGALRRPAVRAGPGRRDRPAPACTWTRCTGWSGSSTTTRTCSRRPSSRTCGWPGPGAPAPRWTGC